MLALWTPLLAHMHVLHPSLPSVLVQRIVAHLTTAEQYVEEAIIKVDAKGSTRDLSYDMCLASWAHWAVCTYDVGEEDEEDTTGLHREDVVISLATNLGPTKQQSSGDDKAFVLSSREFTYPD